MTEDTHVGELLAPVSNALENARLVLGVVAIAVLLVLGGAKLERWLMKRQLSVLDGAADVSEAGSGDRR